MVMSILILAVSIALFFFYIQTLCEKMLRREFSHPYFQEVIDAIQLEYPRLRDSCASKGPVSYEDACLALQCDFITLEYLLKQGHPAHQHLSRHMRVLAFYFRFLLFSMPLRHAFNLHEKEAMLKLASILQFYANLLGESFSVNSVAAAESNLNS